MGPKSHHSSCNVNGIIKSLRYRCRNTPKGRVLVGSEWKSKSILMWKFMIHAWVMYLKFLPRGTGRSQRWKQQTVPSDRKHCQSNFLILFILPLMLPLVVICYSQTKLCRLNGEIA